MVNVTSCLNVTLCRGGGCRAVGVSPSYPQHVHSIWPRSCTQSRTFHLNELNCLSTTLQLDWMFLKDKKCILTFFWAPQENGAPR